MSETRTLSASQSRIKKLMAQSAISREIVVDQEATVGQIGGRNGLLLDIRLPSYRSLPLSCIEKIGATIDGSAADLSSAALRIENEWYPLAALPTLLDIWWFILDTAVLFVPGFVEAGRHEVTIEIVRVEPYITAGRFSFTTSSTATAFVEESAND